MKTQNNFLIAVLLVLVYGLADAQTTFGPQQVIGRSEVNEPNEVNAVDFDGNGFLDILLMSWEDNRISWYRNNGLGVFDDLQIIAYLPTYPQDVLPLDVDYDGDEDVLAAYGDNLVWYENNGTGNFSAEQMLSNSEYIRLFDTGDLNNDGFTDIIADANNSLVWYSGNGDGSFNTPQIIEIQEATVIKELKLADIDGNGMTDIVENSENSLVWYANLGSGNFEAHPINNPTLYYRTLHDTADIDGNGSVDLILGHNTTELVWQSNDGMGNFGDVQVMLSNAMLEYFAYVVAADFDSDGDTDILAETVQVGVGEYTTLLLNEGIEFLIPIVLFSGTNILNNFQIADMNNDGTNDIISSSLTSDMIAWHQFAPDFSYTYLPISSITVNGASDAVAVDINGDGILDVVSASLLDRTLAWYVGDGSGNFGTQQIIADQINFIYDYSVSISILYAGDFNGDATNDIVFISSYGEVILYQNDGTGNFDGGQYLFSISDELESIKIADMDNDNDMDIVVVTSSGNFEWQENDGYGYIISEHNIPFDGSVPSRIYCADMDNDGDNDLITFNNSSVWFSNDGNGNFTNFISVTTEISGITPIQFGDINGDEYIDMLAVSTGTNNLFLLEGDGTGKFTNTQLISSNIGNPIPIIIIADLDNDADNDLIALHNNEIIWFENPGNSVFGTGQNIHNTGNYAYSLGIANLNADNKLDILSAIFKQDKIVWYENLLETVGISPSPNTSYNTPQPIQITPNPTQNTATLTYATPQAQPVTLLLHDLTGRLLFYATLQPTVGTNNFVLDMTRYAQGMYMLTLNDGETVQRAKVVKK